jgi:hypothetical protein
MQTPIRFDASNPGTQRPHRAIPPGMNKPESPESGVGRTIRARHRAETGRIENPAGMIFWAGTAGLCAREAAMSNRNRRPTCRGNARI